MSEYISDIHNSVWVLSGQHLVKKDCKLLINIMYESKGFKLVPCGTLEKVTDLIKVIELAKQNHPKQFSVQDVFDALIKLKEDAYTIIEYIKSLL